MSSADVRSRGRKQSRKSLTDAASSMHSASGHAESWMALGRSASQLDRDIGCCQMLMRPSIIPSMLLHSIAGNSWVAVRSATVLFPLAFRDNQTEVDYRREELKRWPLRVPVAAGVMLFATIFVWISYGSAFARRWIEVDDPFVIGSFHAVVVTIFIFYCVIMSTAFVKALRPHAEVIFYVLAALGGAIMYAWTVYTLDYVEENRDLSDPADFKSWLYLKIVLDVLGIGVLLVALVHCDILLPCLTKKSIWFHIICLLMYCGSKIAQLIIINDLGLNTISSMEMGICLIIYITGFLFRWFRELSERAVFISVRDSQSRLQHIRDTQKNRRRKMGVSAAEEIIELMESVQEAMSLRKADAAGSKTAETPLLDEAATNIQECIRKLARNADADDLVGTGQEAEKGEEGYMAESAFIEMYRVRKGALALKEDELREVRARKTSQVRFAQQEEMDLDGTPRIKVQEGNTLTVDGIEFRRPVMGEAIRSGIGTNFALRLLECTPSPANIIVEVGSVLMAPHAQYLEIEEELLLTCLHAIDRHYWPKNPYHNGVHAANVAHCVTCLMSAMGLDVMTMDLERCAIVVAALGHDIAHPGRNNQFYINSNGILAILQNDNAVLEGAHCALLQSVIGCCQETDIFKYLTKEERIQVRKTIINMVLSTDMSKHFELLSRSRVRRVSAEFDVAKNASDRELVLLLTFKTADLGHALLDWSQHLEWSLRLCEECYQQGDDEARLNLPISPLCDRKDHKMFGKTQSGFLWYVVQPLIEELIELDDNQGMVRDLLMKLVENKRKWDLLMQTGRGEQVPANVLSMKIAHSQWTVAVMTRALKARRFNELLAEISPAQLART